MILDQILELKLLALDAGLPARRLYLGPVKAAELRTEIINQFGLSSQHAEDVIDGEIYMMKIVRSLQPGMAVGA